MSWALIVLLAAPDAGLPESVIEPARAMTRSAPEFPQGATTDRGRAVLEIALDEQGAIQSVKVLESTAPEFAAALRDALTGWLFQPATADGTPIPSVVQLAWDFERPVQLGRLRGRVFKRGVRRPVPGVAVQLRGKAEHDAVTDAEGRFEFEVPVGPYEVRVSEADFAPFRGDIEVLQGITEVEWRITPTGLVGADLVVIGQRDANATGKTTLDRFELTHVAGTMGDPLRVIQSLPGVGNLFSLFPYPVVRGAQPGDTGYFIDGTPIPLLFHLGIGTSVVHPRLVERVDFFPGAAPVQFGRYVGGAVNAVTQRPPADGWITDVDVNLFQSGALVSAPIGEDTRLTVGGRYSYTALLLSLVADDVVLDFWDYSLRLDHDFTPGRRLKVSVFGAQDEFGEESEPDERTFTAFHRVATRYRHAAGDDVVTVGLDLGLDRLDLPRDGDINERAKLSEWLIRPLATLRHALTDGLDLRVGADMEIKPADNDLGTIDEEAQTYISEPQTKYALGAFTALDITWSDFQFTPSFRVDGYSGVEDIGFDPRLGARWKVAESTTLKAHVGIAHAPQRFVVPIPGIGDAELGTPLQRAWQTAWGVEQALGAGFSLDAVAYGNYRQDVLSSFTTDTDEDDVADDSFEVSTHDERAYGLELMLRRKRSQGLFGWVAYTVQRAERKNETGRFEISALDQTHILNVVASYRLGNWLFGARAHYHSGRVVEDDFGDRARYPGFFQLDLRIDKFWIGDNYQIDAYIDVINSTYAGEQTSNDPEDDPVEYILPTIGVHAVF